MQKETIQTLFHRRLELLPRGRHRRHSRWRPSLLLALLTLLPASSPAELQLGPDSIVSGTTIEITAPGTDLQQVIDGISDAAATKPYLLRLGAGVFDIGTSGLVMKPFVAIRGAGKQSTVITAAEGMVDGAIVTMVDDTLLEDLTVRHPGGAVSDAIAVLGAGVGFRVQSARLEASDNGASDVAGFSGARNTGSSDHAGVLSHVEIAVDEGDGIGAGALSGDLQSLKVDNSRILVTNAGITDSAIEDAHFASGSELIVTDTVIEMPDGGIGVRSGDATFELYRNVLMKVVGENTYGFSSSGSGFKPIVEDSRIEIVGSGSRAFSSSCGTIKVRRTTIIADIGLRAAVDCGSFQFDHCVFDVGTGFSFSSTTGASTTLRVAASKLDATTNINIESAGIDELCSNSYDEDYAPVNANCT